MIIDSINKLVKTAKIVHSCLEKRLFGGGAVQKSGSTLTISCVGHSLGGALAILTKGSPINIKNVLLDCPMFEL